MKGRFSDFARRRGGAASHSKLMLIVFEKSWFHARNIGESAFKNLKTQIGIMPIPLEISGSPAGRAAKNFQIKPVH